MSQEGSDKTVSIPKYIRRGCNNGSTFALPCPTQQHGSTSRVGSGPIGSDRPGPISSYGPGPTNSDGWSWSDDTGTGLSDYFPSSSYLFSSSPFNINDFYDNLGRWILDTEIAHSRIRHTLYVIRHVMTSRWNQRCTSHTAQGFTIEKNERGCAISLVLHYVRWYVLQSTYNVYVYYVYF